MPKKTNTATKQPTDRFCEYADNRGQTLVVDREKGVIHDVKVLGRESLNGREYPDATMARALPLYEGAKVNVNHPKGSPTSPRDYCDRFGKLQNVHAGIDGLYADLHFNPKHALAEQLLWDAEHSPGNVGLSHNVVARTSNRDGKVVVEEIERVQSVDLVADPATTKGLFESEGQQTEGDIASTAIEQQESQSSEGIANMDWKDLTVEQLQEHRMDLVEKLQGTDTVSKLQQQLKESADAATRLQQQLKEATDKLAAQESEKALLAKRQTIAEELQKAGVDVANKTICTEAVMQQLEVLADAVTRKPIIDLMAAATKNAQPQQRPVTSFAPLASVRESADSQDFGSLNRFLKPQ